MVWIRQPVQRNKIADLVSHMRCAAGSLGPFEQAEVALAILQRLTDAQAAVDAQGQPLLPLPVAHRHIASQRCLPHIVQVGRPQQGVQCGCDCERLTFGRLAAMCR